MSSHLSLARAVLVSSSNYLDGIVHTFGRTDCDGDNIRILDFARIYFTFLGPRQCPAAGIPDPRVWSWNWAERLSTADYQDSNGFLPFFGQDSSKQPVFQSFRCNHEVEQRRWYDQESIDSYLSLSTTISSSWFSSLSGVIMKLSRGAGMIKILSTLTFLRPQQFPTDDPPVPQMWGSWVTSVEQSHW